MSSADVDGYLAGVPEPGRSTLEELRRCLRDLLPDAEECISYGMPAFRLNGKVIAGFAAFKKHLSYLPHSGSLLSALESELAGYTRTSGSLHFAMDQPLPTALVSKLVAERLHQAESRARR